MSHLAQQGIGPGYQTPAGSVTSAHAETTWTRKSRVQYIQELILILGMQLLFRASLMLRRWNY